MRTLGFPVDYTSKVEDFVAHDGPKLSYTFKRLGEELHIKSSRLLFEQGVSDIELKIDSWKGSPCFFKTADESELPYDIFAAAFYLLSRYEEYLPHVKDAQGRFPASESVAFTNGFIDTPVVDFWAIQFGDVLKQIYPSIPVNSSRFATKMLIEVPQAFAYKKVGFLRTVGGLLKDVSRLRLGRVFNRFQVLLNIRKDPYDVFSWLINVQKQSARKFNYFIELGDYSEDSKNIKYSKMTFRSLIKMICDYSDVGILVSKAASQNEKQFSKEKDRLETIVNKRAAGVRMSKTSLTLPDDYRRLVDQEISKDYTMGYPDTVGFRAGTSKPFLYFDLDYEIQTPLVIVPCTFLATSILDVKKGVVDQVKIDAIVSKLKMVGGQLTTGFTNELLTQQVTKDLFRKIALYDERN